MPVKVKQLPEEPIIVAAITEPLDLAHEMPAMFAEFIRLRLAIQGPVALIMDISQVPDSFSEMAAALAEAGKGIRAGKTAGVGQPPLLIFVGSGSVTAIASEAIDQDQYGGVRGHLCTSIEEALTFAETHLRPKNAPPPPDC